MVKAPVKYIWLVVFVVVFVGTVSWLILFNNEIRLSSKPDFIMEATDLIKAFESNESLANDVYLNKIISLSGIVESISEDSLEITVYLKEKDAKSGIICSFDRDANISDIVKGVRIQIKGKCTGYLMDVIMNKCSVEQQYQIEDIQHPAGIIPSYFAFYYLSPLKYTQSV